MNAVLRVRDVSNIYADRSHGLLGRKIKKPVLDQVSLEVNPGEIFGLVGESGSGKTTLGRCVLGLIPFRGDIHIDNLRQDNRGLGRRRREMALKIQAVFQNPASSLNPVKKAGWILEEPLRIHRRGSPAERRKEVDRMLDLVGLDSIYKSRGIRELSAGQKQRVAIGRALMLRPRLVIADEAVSSLDVSAAAQILNLFRELRQNLGLSLVFISHDLDAVYYLCDRAAVMKRGRIEKIEPVPGIAHY
jgi:ABC-type glutathione transport system ATPase component